MTTDQKIVTCNNCGKSGPVAEDETDAGPDEMACDSRGLVCPNLYVCGECLDAAEASFRAELGPGRARGLGSSWNSRWLDEDTQRL